MHGRRQFTELQIETNKFYLQELTTNEFFKGRPTLFDMCVRGALSCWFGDRGQSEYHSEKAKKVYAQGI